MTGFGSVQGQSGGYRWSIEIRSVNGRGLDIRTRLPEGIDGLERKLREKISAKASRGSVNATIRLSREDADQALAPDPARVGAALDAIAAVEAAAEERGMVLADLRATDVLGLRGVMEGARDTGPTPGDLNAIYADMDSALAEFAEMRAQEGRAVGALLAEQVSDVERLTRDAADAAGERRDRMRTAIEAALETITGATDKVEPGRVEAELALIAVKADVTEELDRLTTHVAAARDLLASKGPIGRKLDFLTQEFNREANTLCSKAQSAKLTAIGLDLKAVIDQMREQVQNVE